MENQSKAGVTGVKCSNCGEPLSLELVSSREKPPCASCGSTARIIMATVEDTITLHEKTGWEANDPNLLSRKKQKKTRVEGVTGSEWSDRLRKMVHKERLIDRKNDRYREVVKDTQTSDVIHEVDEPLSQHTGHGSAKSQKASTNGASQDAKTSNPSNVERDCK